MGNPDILVGSILAIIITGLAIAATIMTLRKKQKYVPGTLTMGHLNTAYWIMNQASQVEFQAKSCLTFPMGGSVFKDDLPDNVTAPHEDCPKCGCEITMSYMDIADPNGATKYKYIGLCEHTFEVLK